MQMLSPMLIELSQKRPDLLPGTRQMLSLCQKVSPDLGIETELACKYTALHELGKYLTAPEPEPLRIAICDLPFGPLIQPALEKIPDVDIPLPVPAIIIALIAWCELRTTPDGKIMSLHQRRLYMERHYGIDHPQYQNWLRLEPLAQVLAKTLAK